MAAASPRNLHHVIQKRLHRFDDLLPIDFHSLWGSNPSQFVENRMVSQRIIDSPDYYFSPSTQKLLGFWNFNIDNAVEDTALFTLLDDVTAELASRLIMMKPRDEPYIGFTVNLNILKCNTEPSASLFFFESRPTHISDRKVIIECPLFDAHTGTKLLVAQAIFVFVPVSNRAKENADNRTESPSNNKLSSESFLPSLDAADSRPLSQSDLDRLSQVMNFLPRGTALHRAGLQSLSKQRLAAVFDFSQDLSGPPIYVHGGLLGTILYNASAMLIANVLGIDSTAADASIRDITYKKGFPLACKNVVVDAVVESIDAESGKIVVFAKLTHESSQYTTLRTTFKLPFKMPSKL
ncbi:hypothetical protein J3B02_003444 [Coemansia erecta]|uniref:Thioesterase domain-containing protein n=1 Tax=Coemansia asiatica TaxID=1052880 RepID=A0A9W7XIZ8_9FUNG|nr:hypothetical protein LPJ64_004799 [Coemansia asiatica]KAJ2852777.1 hypothetical protein J3B02_003444 [Coemansia erecta]KAJ2886310.1 hypothetical protein FB639_001601 [Coemansia asiatica]